MRVWTCGKILGWGNYRYVPQITDRTEQVLALTQTMDSVDGRWLSNDTLKSWHWSPQVYSRITVPLNAETKVVVIQL